MTDTIHFPAFGMAYDPSMPRTVIRRLIEQHIRENTTPNTPVMGMVISVAQEVKNQWCRYAATLGPMAAFRRSPTAPQTYKTHNLGMSPDCIGLCAMIHMHEHQSRKAMLEESYKARFDRSKAIVFHPLS